MRRPWQGSTRRDRLPKDWLYLRQAALRRDQHRCTHVEHGERCNATATDVDHVQPGDDHSLGNLTSLCRGHHATKSSQEGGAAWSAKREHGRQAPEPHPGLSGP